MLFSIKNQKLLYLWLTKQPVLSMKYGHGWLLLKVALFLVHNNQPCQYFIERTGCLAAYNVIILLFLMENSILKIFGSVNVKITPDFCFKPIFFYLMLLFAATPKSDDETRKSPTTFQCQNYRIPIVFQISETILN